MASTLLTEYRENFVRSLRGGKTLQDFINDGYDPEKHAPQRAGGKDPVQVMQVHIMGLSGDYYRFLGVFIQGVGTRFFQTMDEVKAYLVLRDREPPREVHQVQDYVPL